MRPDDFKKIDAFFRQSGKSGLSSIAYVTFIKNVEDGLKRVQNPTASAERQICDNYLTDAQLHTYLTVAEKADESDRRKRFNRAIPFWMSVWSSVVSNIIFAVLLFGLYVAVKSPNSNEILETTTKALSDKENISPGDVKVLPKKEAPPASYGPEI